MPPTPRKKSTTPRRRKSATSPKTAATIADGSTGSRVSPPEPPPESPLGLTGEAFRPPEEGDAPRAQTRFDLEREHAEVPPPPPLEWDRERAETILRGLGSLLHHIDPAGSSPHADDLWLMTEADLDAIAAPGARILNRYSTTRTVAGYSDEAGVLLGSVPYVKRNLATRGRARALDAAARERAEAGHQGLYQPENPPEPASREPAVSQPGSQPESLPERERRVSEPEPPPMVIDHRLADPAGAELEGDEDPKPAEDWMEFFPNRTGA